MSLDRQLSLLDIYGSLPLLNSPSLLLDLFIHSAHLLYSFLQIGSRLDLIFAQRQPEYWTGPVYLDPLPDCTHLKKVSVNSLSWLLNWLVRDWADMNLCISKLLPHDLGGLLFLLLFNTLLGSLTTFFCDGFKYFPRDYCSNSNSEDSVGYLECVKRHVYLLLL